MFLAEFKLYVEPSPSGQFHHVTRTQRHIRETLAALDPGEADIGAEVQVRQQAVLSNRNFKWPSTRDGGNTTFRCGSDFLSRGVLVCYDPASHRYFQNRHQMGALLQMAFQGDRIVTRIKWTG